jgi:hypothetical protein
MRAQLEHAVAALPPISVAALDEIASLQVRTDAKYVVGLERARLLLAALGDG